MKECSKLTDKSWWDCTHSFNSKVGSAHLRLIGLGSTRGNRDLDNAIRAKVGDGNVGSITQNSRCRWIGTISTNYSDTVQTEWIWRCCGWFLPLDGTISLLSSDAVVVPLTRQKLGSGIIVTLHTARNASEVLDTVSWSSKYTCCVMSITIYQSLYTYL